MILVAPDKFKGTLTSMEVCEAVSAVFDDAECLLCPMADGGEGTASLLGENAVDSSSIIGIGSVKSSGLTVMTADSEPLGRKVGEMLASGCEKVIIGVGGTGTCDGGLGFLRGLQEYFPDEESIKGRLLGLCDVEVPLLASGDEPSAMMFARQKGASENDFPILRQRLQEALTLTPRRSRFDGAGGGLGFALASVIGCDCLPGAEYLLKRYEIPWSEVTLVITGEGRLDAQTACGKVVKTVCDESQMHRIPVIIIAGHAENPYPGENVYTYSTTDYYPELPLNRDTALLRLRETLTQIKKSDILKHITI